MVQPGPTGWSPKARNPRSLLHDDARIVELGGASRLAIDDGFRAGPHGQSGTAAAAFLVAHNITPLGSVDVAVAVGERASLLSSMFEIMTRADQVSNLVHQRVGRRCTLVMHD